MRSPLPRCGGPARRGDRPGRSADRTDGAGVPGRPGSRNHRPWLPGGTAVPR